MSTVVVVRKGDRSVIGADTMCVFGNTKMSADYCVDGTKIVRAGDCYLASVGAAAHTNVLRSIIGRYSPELSFKDSGSIFESALRLHEILKETYYLNPIEKAEDPYESSQIDALIAGPYGIFGLYSWREVFEYDRFWAIGSGASFALGAMHATYGRLRDARQIAEVGLAAGCEFDDGSGPPFTMEIVRLRGTKARTTKRPTAH
jgi:ATP-dependent HslUV protease subunit HslV